MNANAIAIKQKECQNKMKFEDIAPNLRCARHDDRLFLEIPPRWKMPEGLTGAEKTIVKREIRRLAQEFGRPAIVLNEITNLNVMGHIVAPEHWEALTSKQMEIAS